MRIVIDGQKLPVNIRTSRDLLVMVKSLARNQNWRTEYDPAKEVVYLSTEKESLTVQDREYACCPVDELESYRLQDKIIFLDPGHGGWDPGAIGPNGTREKDNTLAIAVLLKEKLEANGATVIMSRMADQALCEDCSKREELGQRVSLANDTDADIFISIHNDSFSNGRSSGTTTFHYGDEKSIDLATAIQTSLVHELGTKDRGIRFASFYVLRYTSMPAVLIEAAFISNPEEELLLASCDGREKIADSIYCGIVRYFKV